jgi:hypothetical protein
VSITVASATTLTVGTETILNASASFGDGSIGGDARGGGISVTNRGTTSLGDVTASAIAVAGGSAAGVAGGLAIASGVSFNSFGGSLDIGDLSVNLLTIAGDGVDRDGGTAAGGLLTATAMCRPISAA